MIRNLFSFLGVMVLVFFLSGCFSSSNDEKEETVTSYKIQNLSGGVARSVDNGITYEPFISTTGGGNIKNINIFSMQFSRSLGRSLYIGTEKNGLFKKTELGDGWENISFPPIKLYGLEVFEVGALENPLMYVSGVLEGRAKIYKSSDGGKEWKEIYTEPAGDSVILSLAIHPKRPNIIYASTSEGIVIQSEDAGVTWKNIHTFSSPVMQLEFDNTNPDVLYVLLFENDIKVSRDGGRTFIEKDQQNRASNEEKKKTSLASEKAYSLAVDPNRSGTVYVGTGNGLFRSIDYGMTWESVNIIESVSKEIIRAVAINPFSSEEIIFGAGSVIYKSTNRGESWQTFQLDTKAMPVFIGFDPANQGSIYVAFRSF
ncbi:MAG: hypothetical protein IPN70_00040 [Candidatus Moraniibacteriota bacterium]|nr:MAG: hypothetical protein IPN70_00040 [Candidatus Moranbacteria bacterium]